MTTDRNEPDTIVLVHGLWMTPRSWEAWVPYYEAKGYTVLTPTYPGFEVEVEALREDPTPIATATVPGPWHISRRRSPPSTSLRSSWATVRRDPHTAPSRPGRAAAGVVIDSAPTEGVRVNPLSQIKSLFPALKNPRTATERPASRRRSSTTRSPTRSARNSQSRSTTGTTSRHPGAGSGHTA